MNQREKKKQKVRKAPGEGQDVKSVNDYRIRWNDATGPEMYT